MRIRSFLVVGLMAPAIVSGQVVRRGGLVGAGGESPARPKELPPQSEQIAEDIYMKQARTYTAQYPILSFVSSPGFDAQTRGWVSYGYGYSLGYMYKENLAITGDFVSSLLGGPQVMESVDIGWRYFPNRDYERKLTPFLDGRGAYHLTVDRYATTIPGSIISNPQYQHDTRLTNGFGLVGGAGFYYPLWANIDLSTEVLATRSRLTTIATSADTKANPYSMTQYGFTVGFTYTPRMTRYLRSRAIKNRVLK